VSYETYKILHFIGILSLFLALGALLTHQSRTQKKKIMMLHGAATFLLFVSGFGLLARLNILHFLPTWSLLKVLLWLILGILVPVLLSFQFSKKWIWITVWVCGLLSVVLAVTKAFP